MPNKETVKRKIPASVKAVIVVVLVVVLLVVLVLVRQNLQSQTEKQETENQTWATPVTDDNKALIEFKKNHPGEEICLACEGDITGDGKPDLLVITRDEQNAYTTPMIAESDSSWYELDRVRAPYENQKMKFIDFDKDGVDNALISGERNTKIGYAIYRITKENKFVDVFGEGMADCC